MQAASFFQSRLILFSRPLFVKKRAIPVRDDALYKNGKKCVYSTVTPRFLNSSTISSRSGAM